ncbi:MAG: hypothetical protein ACTSU5_02570 [Promethearchaeota archaeon]
MAFFKVALIFLPVAGMVYGIMGMMDFGNFYIQPQMDDSPPGPVGADMSQTWQYNISNTGIFEMKNLTVDIKLAFYRNGSDPTTNTTVSPKEGAFVIESIPRGERARGSFTQTFPVPEEVQSASSPYEFIQLVKLEVRYTTALNLEHIGMQMVMNASAMGGGDDGDGGGGGP